MSALYRKASRALPAVKGQLLVKGEAKECWSQYSNRFPTLQQYRRAHTVRLIALEDLPHGKAYKGDVIRVKAGYARNFLIPQKKALYAIPQNFRRLEMTDPEIETEEQRLSRLERESASPNSEEERLVKQADTLRHYLRNKVVRMLCSFSGSP